MNKWISRYKVKTDKSGTGHANVLYDFVIVALASLIFNGFIINGHSSEFDQKIFMLLNVGLLSTHWYQRTFFAQRYEKKGMDFRALLFLSIFSLGAMAVSIDSLVFVKNKDDVAQAFLNEASMYIWFAGYILSRLVVSFEYFMSAQANKDSRSLFKLTIYKSASRLLTVIIASVGLILIKIGVERSLVIYTIIPSILVIEYLGNIACVTEKNLKNAPEVSYTSLKERYSKINNVLISAFIISGSIQFAFYFHYHSDLYMLARISMVYIIAFALWWTYANRVYRFGIKRMAKTHVYLGGTNIILAASLTLMGGMLINANDNVNIDIIIPSVLLSLAVFTFIITLNVYTFTSINNNETFNKAIKIRFIIQAALVFFPVLIVGITSIYFSYSVWVMYGITIGALSILALSARYDIETKIKNHI